MQFAFFDLAVQFFERAVPFFCVSFGENARLCWVSPFSRSFDP